MNIWRLTTRDNITEAFDGQGAFKYGGRWNSKGTKLVYCSDSISLAILENLVHFDIDIAPPLYLFEIEIENKQVYLDPKLKQLLSNERRTKQYGDEWVFSLKSLALEIPSAVVNREKNYLLNPEHTCFKKIKIIPHGLFDLDTRLTN